MLESQPVALPKKTIQLMNIDVIFFNTYCFQYDLISLNFIYSFCLQKELTKVISNYIIEL